MYFVTELGFLGEQIPPKPLEIAGEVFGIREPVSGPSQPFVHWKNKSNSTQKNTHDLHSTEMATYQNGINDMGKSGLISTHLLASVLINYTWHLGVAPQNRCDSRNQLGQSKFDP